MAIKGERPRLDATRQMISFRPGVDPDGSEICPKARLKERSIRMGEGLAGTIKSLQPVWQARLLRPRS